MGAHAAGELASKLAANQTNRAKIMCATGQPWNHGRFVIGNVLNSEVVMMII